VCADFSRRGASLDSTLPLQPITTSMLSLSEATHTIRAARADIVALMRGGESTQQFVVFKPPKCCAWSKKRADWIADIQMSGQAQCSTCSPPSLHNFHSNG
jgi:hypothetical protein